MTKFMYHHYFFSVLFNGFSFSVFLQRVSFIVSEAPDADRWAGEGSSTAGLIAKKEEVMDEDFTFDEPCLKKQKTSNTCQGQPTTLPQPVAQALKNELNMNWDLTQVEFVGCFVFICGRYWKLCSIKQCALLTD